MGKYKTDEELLALICDGAESDDDILSDFGKENMIGWQRESYNEPTYSHVGEYRDYHDGKIDPCDDALWLHDQE